MDFKEEIYTLIPHRPPFLWIDRIIELGNDSIVAEKTIPEDLEVFTGHYPDYPLMPGVLVCEAVFQAGAILIADFLKKQGDSLENGVPVLTRINNAKFKRQVKPGAVITIKAKITEMVASAWFLKGMVSVGDKTVLKVNFACALSQTSTAP